MPTPPAPVQSEDRIDFRPLQDDDPHMLLRWLRDPDVSPWYGEGEVTLVHLQATYATRIAGTDTTHASIFTIDGIPAGYIQWYRIADEPDYASQLELPQVIEQGAVSTDLYIGEATYRNRGWGRIILGAFLRRFVFGELEARVAIIAPEPSNKRAIRTYERIGFTWLKTVLVVEELHPENTGEEYLMVMTRSAFLA